ncbi:hypothetical protein BGZ83_002813 [Gryganskiella cystojenkinii]|nr:hypothetical protein BGZ83_002813 [Gryganskiella cystojenkinii]
METLVKTQEAHALECEFWLASAPILHDPSNRSSALDFYAGVTILATIRYLDLIGTRGLKTMEDQLVFLKLCPDLEKFTLDSRHRMIYICRDSIGKSLTTHLRARCPKLKDIDLRNNTRVMDEFSQFLEAWVTRAIEDVDCNDLTRQQIEGLSLRSYWFGEQSWRLIQEQGHHRTLRRLNLDQESSIIDGKMIQEILFAFFGTSSSSTGTTHVPIPTIGQVRAQSQNIVFERLSTLRRIQVLDLSWVVSRGSFFRASVTFLRFGLEHGLDMLMSLQDLREMHLAEDSLTSSSSQNLSKNDIRWMLSSWSRLAILSGRLHKFQISDNILRAVLMEEGVKDRGVERISVFVY